MKRTTTPFVRRIAVLTLCVLITNLAMAEWPSGAAARYDGETLMRGIFFSRGPVADLLPEVWQSAQLARYTDQMRTPEAIELQEKLLLRVRNDDAAGVAIKVKPAYFGEEPLEAAAPGTFFTRFADDLQSGDRLRMQGALREAAVRVDAAMRVELGKDPRVAAVLRGGDRDLVGRAINSRDSERRGSGPQVREDLVGLAIAIVLAVGLAVAVVIAAVAVDVWWMSHSEPGSPERLRSEMFVDLMATRLAH